MAVFVFTYRASAYGDYYIFSLGVQTPNCIRQTAFDAVALDYHEVTLLVDATAAATPDIHIGKAP